MITDEQLIAKANDLLSKGNYTRFGLSKQIGTTKERLDKLAKTGVIKNYPKPLTPSQAATYGRMLRGDRWGKKFKLKGSPRWEQNASQQS